jgi:hypothetical protein
MFLCCVPSMRPRDVTDDFRLFLSNRGKRTNRNTSREVIVHRVGTPRRSGKKQTGTKNDREEKIIWPRPFLRPWSVGLRLVFFLGLSNVPRPGPVALGSLHFRQTRWSRARHWHLACSWSGMSRCRRRPELRLGQPGIRS